MPGEKSEVACFKTQGEIYSKSIVSIGTNDVIWLDNQDIY